eukprot:tig00001067_g6768.t1
MATQQSGIDYLRVWKPVLVSALIDMLRSNPQSGYEFLSTWFYKHDPTKGGAENAEDPIEGMSKAKDEAHKLQDQLNAANAAVSAKDSEIASLKTRIEEAKASAGSAPSGSVRARPAFPPPPPLSPSFCACFPPPRPAPPPPPPPSGSAEADEGTAKATAAEAAEQQLASVEELQSLLEHANESKEELTGHVLELRNQVGELHSLMDHANESKDELTTHVLELQARLDAALSGAGVAAPPLPEHEAATAESGKEDFPVEEAKGEESAPPPPAEEPRPAEEKEEEAPAAEAVAEGAEPGPAAAAEGGEDADTGSCSSLSTDSDSDAEDPRMQRMRAMKLRIKRRGEVRVFLSSTFQDMRGERDAFRALVSSKMRGLCAERGLYFHLVDLRWGITGEEATSGEVTRLCLEQVQKSTYFVCILKGRYGWHDTSFSSAGAAGAKPNEADALFRKNLEIAERGGFGGVRQWADRSVTEIEIREGVLSRLQEAKHTSLFYFASEAVAQASREADAAAGRGEGPYAIERLAALKEEIRASGVPMEEYSDWKWPAAAASEALADKLRGDFALNARRDGFGRYQAGFAAGFRRVYAGDGADEAALGRPAAHRRERLRQDSAAGELGRGVEAGHPSDLVLVHCAAATWESCELSNLLFRLRDALRGAGMEGFPELEGAGRLDDEEAAGLVRRCWRRGRGRGRGGSSSPSTTSTSWAAACPRPRLAPAAAGPRLRILATCLPAPSPRRRVRRAGRSWSARRRPSTPPAGASSSTASSRRPRPPAPAELPVPRAEALGGPGQGQGKRLRKEEHGRVTSAGACESPLYVALLLEELAQRSIHDNLEQDLGALLGSGTPAGLLRHVLRRLGEEHAPSAARKALSALLCARAGAGLEMPELMDFCGALMEEPMRGDADPEESPPGTPTLGYGPGWRPPRVDAPTPWALLWANIEPLVVCFRARDESGRTVALHRLTHCAAEAVGEEYGLGAEAAARAVRDEYDAFLETKRGAPLFHAETRAPEEEAEAEAEAAALRAFLAAQAEGGGEAGGADIDTLN